MIFHRLPALPAVTEATLRNLQKRLGANKALSRPSNFYCWLVVHINHGTSLLLKSLQILNADLNRANDGEYTG
jgi:hypothetical protein